MVFQPCKPRSRYACARHALWRAHRIIEEPRLEHMYGRGMRNCMEIATFGDVIIRWGTDAR